ncbi:SMC domain-containing protein [[Clostridium] sordellii]|uniref:ATP-dependent nuclease n=1 Tax=Paraclostridium sordellii TaxID=1505 RepID=UPI0005E7DABD|nr:TOPRIM nucleotidyl transferase/hydrolase domain-containing protein [Paeniclostridium sordellii]CEQ06502.1 SMC domain-containing protein [[Clostridium] sordellii] [Paeniclostridium sordellii]
MKLKSLAIENFRNFDNIKINLTNQNVVFGMNDVGKTNLLFAIRFLLDRDIRKNGFKETDYFKNNTNRVIRITLGIDLSDRLESEDSQHIIAKVGGARSSKSLDDFFLQVEGIYDKSEEIGIPKIYWGSNLENLYEINQNGIYSNLDNLFKIVYVDPTIDLEKTFSKNRNKLFNQNKLDENDIQISNDIKTLGIEMNKKISNMGVIQSFQKTITDEYKKLKKEKINIEMKSEITINGYFGNLIPYIKKENDDNIYPTAGDGRKKILAYSLINHLIQEQEGNKIIIYLVEEPENSLHRSMQIALSKQLFSSEVYKYFFLSTHSSELLYEMDNASLIRIYSDSKINCNSYIYNVSEEYKNVKKELNSSLATALFAEKVLLVEGPSEKVLFEKVLEKVYPTYELEGGYILEVSGIKFKPYVDVLKGLNITPIVKTDNDLKAKKGNQIKFDLIGITRCLNIMGIKEHELVEPVEIDYFYINDKGNRVYKNKVKNNMIIKKKIEIFNNFKDHIESFKHNNIYLSKIDLEHDLYEAIGKRMEEILGSNPVNYLQEHKLINMIELTNSLTENDCNDIINHYLFEPLRKLVPNDTN